MPEFSLCNKIMFKSIFCKECSISLVLYDLCEGIRPPFTKILLTLIKNAISGYNKIRQ